VSKVTLTSSSGHPIAVEVSIPAGTRSVVIMSHGFTSSKNSSFYTKFESELNDAGLGSIRYDYYGHGELYGFEGAYGVTPDMTLGKALDSLTSVVSYARSLRMREVGLLGASFGGLVSLVYASRNQDIRALVLKSPVTDPVAFWKSRLGQDGIAEWERCGQTSYGEGPARYTLSVEFWHDLQLFDTLTEARGIGCPTLIVHGGNDTVVPIEHSKNLSARIKSILHVVPGAGHAYDGPGQIDEFKKVSLEFFREHLPTESSRSASKV
jgi:uncharacterized protein